MSANDRTISLEARMDAQLRSFGYGYQEEQAGSSLPRRAVQGVAAATLVGGAGAAYKNREAIATAGKDADRKGLKKTASYAGQASNSLHKTALKSSGLKMQAAGGGSELLRKATSGLRGVAKSFSRADIDQVLELAERIALLELEAEADNVIEFGDTEQRSKLGVGLAGAAGGNYINGINAIRAQDRFEKAGHVYRKRDAVKDSLKGTAVGTGVSVGLFGGGLGGAAALGTLAAKRKLPKGILRKAGVKAGKAFRGMNGEKLKSAGKLASIGGLGASIYAQGKFADNRLAKRQAQA